MPSPSRLLFPLTENNAPSGGRKFTYHVVDLLNDAGFEAWIIHPRDKFRLNWFPNKTKVGQCLELFPNQNEKNWLRNFFYLASPRRKKSAQRIDSNASNRLEIQESDIIFIPETRLGVAHRMPKINPKIIFNQNPYFMFKQQLPEETRINDLLAETNVKAVIAASKLTYEFQNLVLPKMPSFLVQLFIEDIFCFQNKKKTQIAYMPRRRLGDAQAVINMLRARGLDKHVSFIAIDDLSQIEVAKILRESLIFMSFSEREGFGLPSAEAMASGCAVVGYTGGGGDEFFDPEYCFPVQEGDLLSFVGAIENILHMNNSQTEELDNMRRTASETIRTRYSYENSRQSIIQAFTKACESTLN